MSICYTQRKKPSGRLCVPLGGASGWENEKHTNRGCLFKLAELLYWRQVFVFMSWENLKQRVWPIRSSPQAIYQLF